MHLQDWTLRHELGGSTFTTQNTKLYVPEFCRYFLKRENHVRERSDPPAHVVSVTVGRRMLFVDLQSLVLQSARSITMNIYWYEWTRQQKLDFRCLREAQSSVIMVLPLTSKIPCALEAQRNFHTVNLPLRFPLYFMVHRETGNIAKIRHISEKLRLEFNFCQTVKTHVVCNQPCKL